MSRPGEAAPAKSRKRTVTRARPPATTSQSRQRPVMVDGIAISHPSRVVDPSGAWTKLDVVRYYEAIAPVLLPHLKDRPVALVRLPDGIDGEQFFQKHVRRGQIPGARQLDPALDPGHPPLLVLEAREALIGAAQMGVVELHTWNAVGRRMDRPDRLVFDLDPDPALPWARVLEAAELTRNLLEDLGLRSFVKTSGGKGLHVVVPLRRLYDWETAKAFSRSIAEYLAADQPARFGARMGAANRVGKVFVDYLRNNRGSTTVAAWSLRARPGLPVSVPVDWEELVELGRSDQWNVGSIDERLADQGRVPWQDYEQSRQGLKGAMTALEVRRRKLR